MTPSGDDAVFSHKVPAGDLPPAGLDIHLSASDRQCAVIAERLGLLALERLTFTGQVCRDGKNAARVDGRLQARAVQTCIVSLAPVDEDIDAVLSIRLVPEEDLAVDMEPDPDGPDIEPLSGGEADMAELAVQYLAVLLDPYPRRADAQPPGAGIIHDAEAEAVRNSPFAVLQKLKENP